MHLHISLLLVRQHSVENSPRLKGTSVLTLPKARTEIELQDLTIEMSVTKTAELEFEEFSYLNDEGKLYTSGSPWFKLLAEYIIEHFGVLSVSEALPFLLMWCEDAVPPPSERPFRIAGMVAVWLVHGKDEYPLVRFNSYLPLSRSPILSQLIGDWNGTSRQQ